MKSKKLQIDINHIKTSLTTFIKSLLFFVGIEGESAWPELIPGRVYLASRLKRPRINSFIVFVNPKDKTEILVKKIKEIRKGSFIVSGNLPWSSSSKDFGQILPKSVLGGIIKIV